MPQIMVSEIEYVLSELFKRLKQSGIEEFSFDEDLYWNVPTDQVTVLPTEPMLTIGSIEDDINFLKSLKEEAYSTEYLEVERLSSLFKIISLRLCRF